MNNVKKNCTFLTRWLPLVVHRLDDDNVDDDDDHDVDDDDNDNDDEDDDHDEAPQEAAKSL